MRTRRRIQIVSLILHNGYLSALFTKNLYTGFLKGICAPGLNCHSCPTSLFSCPLGILQNVMASFKVYPLKIILPPFFYVVGFFLLFGIALGRFVCGWLCPFGLIQDLIFKPHSKAKILTNPKPEHRKSIKFAIFIGLVLAFPVFFFEESNYGILGFCKFLCPAGTLEAGYLNLLLHTDLREFIGLIFYFKSSMLILIFLLCVVQYRFFCKNLCPLGLIYGFFNKFSWLRLSIDKIKCNDCKVCEKACLMNIQVTKNINSLECIRCLNCMHICPHRAIKLEKGFRNVLL